MVHALRARSIYIFFNFVEKSGWERYTRFSVGFYRVLKDIFGFVRGGLGVLGRRFDYLFRRSIWVDVGVFLFQRVSGDEGTKRGEKTGRRAL